MYYVQYVGEHCVWGILFYLLMKRFTVVCFLALVGGVCVCVWVRSVMCLSW